MNRLRLVIPALTGAPILALSGCGSAAERELDGIQFESRSGQDAGGELSWIADEPVLWSMTTMNGDYTAVISAPCNTLNAAVSVTADTITVDTDNVAMTAMACEEPIASMDEWVHSFIAEPINYTWDGETLAMSNDQGGLTFNRVAD